MKSSNRVVRRLVPSTTVMLVSSLLTAATISLHNSVQSAVTTSDASDAVDYRYYSLDSWLGMIGLPDDCFKCAVDADGQFLTEYGAPHGHPGVYPAQNRLTIRIDLLGGSTRMDQKMHSPRAPIAITRKRQGDVAITEHLFLARPLSWSASVKGDTLKNCDSKPDCRQYLLMVEYANEGAKATEVVPVIHIAGAVAAAKSPHSRQAFAATSNTQCWISDQIVSFESKELKDAPFVFGTARETFEFPGPHRATVTLKKIAIAPGGKAQCLVAINRNGFKGDGPLSWHEADSLRRQAIVYWEKSTSLPCDVIQIPDPEIQALLDTSIRELYQMRYVSGGLPIYFFGPGTYNDYWVLDSSYVIEALAMLGRVEDASGSADYMLTKQQNDGRIQNMANHWKETGIALLTLYSHARLIQDKNWLLQRWPQFARAVDAIKQLRRTGTSADPNSLNFGLSPPGFGDGGIMNDVEYTNNHWLLAGMKAAVESAEWLDKSGDADAWKKEYQDFEQTYHKAVSRDAKTDADGNRYIPVLMGPKPSEHPTRGQWAFCQGVYPGRIFAQDDSLMRGTMNMLAAHEVQGGIVEDSGWIGIWAQCAFFYGHDWLWLGDGKRASHLLYAFANHASPLRNWREEMPKQTKPKEVFSFDRGSGSMPHVSASAEFIRLAGHLLALDRGNDLHLFEGLPLAWLKPGMTTQLNGLRTAFGTLILELKVASDGKTASLRIAALSDPSCRKIIVHVGGWTSAIPGTVEEFVARQTPRTDIDAATPRLDVVRQRTYWCRQEQETFQEARGPARYAMPS